MCFVWKAERAKVQSDVLLLANGFIKMKECRRGRDPVKTRWQSENCGDLLPSKKKWNTTRKNYKAVTQSKLHTSETTPEYTKFSSSSPPSSPPFRRLLQFRVPPPELSRQPFCEEKIYFKKLFFQDGGGGEGRKVEEEKKKTLFEVLCSMSRVISRVGERELL